MKKFILFISILTTLIVNAQYDVQPMGFTACVGSDQVLRATIGNWYNVLCTVDWYKDGVVVSHIENTGAGPHYNPDINQAGSHVYWCVITNQISHASLESNHVTVTYSNIYPDTQIGSITGPSQVCVGTTQVYTVPPVNNASSYSWTLPQNASIILNNGNSITVSFGATTNSGNISVKGQTICGSSNTAVLPIIVYKDFSNIAISGPTTVCPKDSYTYSVPADPNVTSYQWTLPTGVMGSSTTNSINVIFPTNATVGNVTVKRTNMCFASSITSLSISINPLPSTPSSIIGRINVCKGQSNVLYTVPDTVNATSYSWTLSGATGNSTTNAISLSFSDISSSATISVRGNNSCGDGNAVTMNVQIDSNCLPQLLYNSPQNYKLNSAITPLTPSNTGGAVLINSSGQISTLAGNGSLGSADGIGSNASFNNPNDIEVDFLGNVYVADRENHSTRKITPNGVVSTLAGGGGWGYTDGIGSAASFSYPSGVTTDVSGNIYVAEETGIRKIDKNATVSTLFNTFKSNGGYIRYKVAINYFTNYLYVLNDNNTISKVSPSGQITNFAGSGLFGSTDGIGSAASFWFPQAIAVGYTGNVYVADAANNKIRKITPAGIVSTLAGTGVQGYSDGMSNVAMFYSPSGVAVDINENVYVADLSNKIRKITPAGVVTTLAGSGAATSTDGTFFQSSFKSPIALTVDYTGNNIYIIESNKVRKITMSGYTITPALPTGLNFDSTTGIITGTPTILTPVKTYTITAYNEYGSSSTDIIISTITSLGLNDYQKDEFVYFPNPVNEIINFKNNNPISTITLFNLLGQIIAKKEIYELSGQLDMSKFPKGHYLLTFKTDNGESTVKLIKK